MATRRRYKKWSPHKHGESHRCHRPCHRHMPHQAAEKHREHEPVAQPPQPGGEVASFKSKLSLKHWQELWPRPCQHKSITCPIQQALGAGGFGGLHPPRGSRRDTARSCCELRDGDGTCLRSESRKQQFLELLHKPALQMLSLAVGRRHPCGGQEYGRRSNWKKNCYGIWLPMGSGTAVCDAPNPATHWLPPPAAPDPAAQCQDLTPCTAQGEKDAREVHGQGVKRSLGTVYGTWTPVWARGYPGGAH